MIFVRSLAPLLLTFCMACPVAAPAEGEGEPAGEGEPVGEGEGEPLGEGEGEPLGEGEGEEGEGEGCGVSEDCPAFNFCGHISMVSTAGCDYLEIEEIGCASNVDCPNGFVCDAVELGCSQSEPQCVPACEDATDCATDEECVAGRCESLSCNGDRYRCPEGAECTVVGPLSPFANPFDTYGKHGCEFVGCTTSADCTNVDGTCIAGLCQEGPGQCLTMGG
jgi:hypothetical protein